MRAGQEQVVRALIDGRSALAVFPTGGGKSLCYQLPALLMEGLTLVISPLIALMKDQVDALVAKGIPAARLDSTLSQQEAFEVFDRLRDGTLKLLYVAPERLANEGFRTRGRDGQPSICEWLACGDDLPVLENFIYGDTPTPQAVRHLIDRVLRLGTNFDVSQYDLSSSCDIRPLVVSTVLTYLELEGVIEATGSFYSGYAANLLRDFKRVLAGYDERRRDFLTRLFAAGTKGRVWTNFDIDSVADQIGEPRERIVSALIHLEEAGDLALKKTGIRQGYRLLRDPGDLHALAERLNARFQHREHSDLERLRQVVALAEAPGCLTGALTAHFGETLDHACGHCDRCRGIPAAPIPRSEPRQPGDEEWAMIRDLGRERHAALGTTRQLARFLCGLTSPATLREKLTRHDAFGLLSDLPFSEVLAIAEAQ